MKKTFRGFIFTEVLIVTLILGIVISAVLLTFISAQLSWMITSQQALLQTDGALLMQKMERGVDGRHGIREATTIYLPTSSQISYTSGIDSVTRGFYASGGNVYYDPDTSVSSDEILLCQNVSSLSFSASGDVVSITLSLQKAVRSKSANVTLKTDIFKRN